MAEGAEAGEAKGPRREGVGEVVADYCCGGRWGVSEWGEREEGRRMCGGDGLMRLSVLGWLRPRARVRAVDEKGDTRWAEGCRDRRAERTWLGGGLMGFEVRRGIWNAAASDCSTGLSFILNCGLVCGRLSRGWTCRRARNCRRL